MSETIDPHHQPPWPHEIETTVITADLVRAAMPKPPRRDPAAFDYDTRPIRDQGLRSLSSPTPGL